MKKAVDKICGWELNNPDREVFESCRLEADEQTCEKSAFKGTVPNGTIRCLLPRKGLLFNIGYSRTLDGDRN